MWRLAVPVLALLWMALRGFSLAEFGLGLVAGSVAVLPFRGLYGRDVSLRRLPGLMFWGSMYVAVFVYEVVKANISLAYFVLHPSAPIDPVVAELPLEVETELGISLIANSITLTPGTLTLDYVEEGHFLRVHAIAGTPEEVVEDMELLQRLASRMGI